jgi:hypothetical protein
VEEAAFLMPVDRIVGGVEIEDDLFRRRRRLWVRVEKEVDEQSLDRRRIVADLVIARRPGLGCRRVLEPVQGRLAGQGRTIGAPPRGELAGEHGQRRIMPQLVMVEEILVAERDPEDALADQHRERVFDPLGGAAILKARGKTLDEADRPISCAEQQRAGIRGDRAAVERGDHGAAFDRCKSKLIRATLCRHRGDPLKSAKSFSQNNFRSFRAPMHLPRVRNPG